MDNLVCALSRGRLLLCAAAALAAAPASAHAQAAVAGTVLDAASSAPVADVAVRAIDAAGRERLRVVSDSAGAFRIPLPAGRYTFQVERIGYEALNTPVVDLRRGELVTVEIRLGVAPVAIEPLVIRSRVPRAIGGADIFRRRMARQQAMGQGRFITREDIEETSVVSVNDLLARVPSVRIMPLVGRSGSVDAVVLDHAGRRCLPALYLDGVLVGWTGETDLRDFYQPDMLEGIEIYRSEVETPPELRRQGCGAVALWTRGARGHAFSLRRIGIAAGFVTAVLLVRGLD